MIFDLPLGYYLVPIVTMAIPLARVIDNTLRRVRVPQKVFAIDMRYSEPYLSRIISGEKGMDVRRLLECDPALVRAFGEALIECAGGEAPLTRSVVQEAVAEALRSVMAGHQPALAQEKSCA
jgi:hypothetical protein